MKKIHYYLIIFSLTVSASVFCLFACAQTPQNVTSTPGRVITWQVSTLPESFNIQRSFEYDGVVRAYWGTTIPVTVSDVVCSHPDGDGTELCTYSFGAAYYTRTYAAGVYTFTYFDYGCYTGADFQAYADYFLNTLDGNSFRISTNMRNRNFKADVVWRVQSVTNGFGSIWSLYTIPVQP